MRIRVDLPIPLQPLLGSRAKSEICEPGSKTRVIAAISHFLQALAGIGVSSGPRWRTKKFPRPESFPSLHLASRRYYCDGWNLRYCGP